MAAYIITYRFSKKGNSGIERNQRRQAFLEFLNDYVGFKNIKNFNQTKTTSTRIIRIKKSLDKISKKIKKENILHDNDTILFFKIFDEEKPNRSNEFDLVGKIENNEYKEYKRLTNFINNPPV